MLRVACGVWRVACGVWRVACGVWRVTCGVWRVACGVWRVALACSVQCAVCLRARVRGRGFMCMCEGERKTLEAIEKVGAKTRCCCVAPPHNARFSFQIPPPPQSASFELAQMPLLPAVSPPDHSPADSASGVADELVRGDGAAQTWASEVHGPASGPPTTLIEYGLAPCGGGGGGGGGGGCGRARGSLCSGA